MRIFDAHNDYFTALNAEEAKAYQKKLKKSRGKVISSIYTTELKNPLGKINKLNKNTELIHIEDLGFLDSNKMGKLTQIKPFSCGLTWNYKNHFAGGCLSSGGVTKDGKQLIKFLATNGIKIDLAHLNRKSFWQIAKLNLPRGSVFCSHTAINSVNKHLRNLTNKQIEYIIKKGGLVGICFVSQFLNGKSVSTSDDVCNHIMYFIKKWGADNLCIGTDFYGTKDLPIDLTCYEDFALLKKKLIKRGVLSTDVNKIFYQNLKRFTKQNKGV